MTSVNMFEAKTNLSKYVLAVEEKKEAYILITRNGKPVAKIVPYDDQPQTRIGLGKGILPEMPSLDEFNSVSVEEDFLDDGGVF